MGLSLNKNWLFDFFFDSNIESENKLAATKIGFTFSRCNTFDIVISFGENVESAKEEIFFANCNNVIV